MAKMRTVFFIVVYTLGLAMLLPLELFSSKYHSTWLMFLSPVFVVVIAEIVTLKIKITKNYIQSRIAGLLISWMIIGFFGKIILGEDEAQAIGMVAGLGAIYQLPIILVCSLAQRRRQRLAEE
jgi:hypothetical protein